MAGLADLWKASPLGVISTGAGVGLNLAKGIFGAFQNRKANKQINKLLNNPVTYKRPEEYEQELAMRKQMASQQRLPGQGYIEQNIGQSVAQALSAAEKGAISSNVYQKSVGSILDKQMNAFQNLGLQAAQYQQQNKENLFGTLQRGAGYSDTEYQENVVNPYERKLNMAFSNKQAAQQNMWGGAEGAIGNLSDFAGTSYYKSILGNMMGGGASTIGGGNGIGTGFQSKPLGYNPDGNLLKYIR